MMMIQISVEDTGIDISEESRKSLLQPFNFQAGAAHGRWDGCRSVQLVQEDSGCAGVTSRADRVQGSMFWFTFFYGTALTKKQREQMCTLEPQTKIDSTVLYLADSIQSRKTLIVDDSLSTLRVTLHLLKINGHSIETASNGSIGLKRLKKLKKAKSLTWFCLTYKCQSWMA